MVLGPMASAAALNLAIAYVGPGDTWIQVVKVFGVLVSGVELVLCCSNVDNTGAASTCWGLLCAVAGCGVILAKGRDEQMFALCVGAYVMEIVGYVVCMALPSVCAHHARVVDTAAGPLYVRDSGAPQFPLCSDGFDRFAFIHICSCLSLVLMYFGAGIKADRDRALEYLEVMRSAYKQQPRCCGC